MPTINVTTLVSESSTTGLDISEASSSGSENIFAYLFGASGAINLCLIGIIIVMAICKLTYLQVILCY